MVALSMCGCTHSAAAHSVDIEQLSCAEPGSEIAVARGRRIKLRLSAKVFAAPLGSRKQSHRRRVTSKRLSEFIDVAFVPAGLRDETRSQVADVASKLENLFVPAPLRKGVSERNLVAERSAAPIQSLHLDSNPSKRRERRAHNVTPLRRGSEDQQGEDVAPCGAGAETAPSGHPQVSAPTLQGRRRMPAPLTAASHLELTTESPHGETSGLIKRPAAASDSSNDSEEADSHQRTTDSRSIEPRLELAGSEIPNVPKVREKGHLRGLGAF
jgi:hypothetical protein